MKNISDLIDKINDTETYQFDNGQRIHLSGRDVRRYGAEAMVREMGYSDLLSKERVPVFFHGRIFGTLPGNFDHRNIKTGGGWGGFLYAPREGDFERKDDGWHAAGTLGPGDVEAIAGFQREW